MTGDLYKGATEMTQDKRNHGDNDRLDRLTHGPMMPQVGML